MKNIISFILSCLVIAITISLCGCGDNKEKFVIAPSQSYIINCLQQVPGVLDVEAVTELSDPNNLLNKAGGYYASVYFSYSLVDQDELSGDTIIEKGLEAGGCIEVYKTKNEAKKRNNYLAAFDGTFLATGSHMVIGTIVIRTSNLLNASQQRLLESNIVAVLTGNFKDLNNNIEPNNKYNLFTFPTIGNSGQSVKYFVYYSPLGKEAEFAKININSYTYSFNDEYEDVLQLNLTFHCSVIEMYNGDIGFSIILHNGRSRMTREVLGTVSAIGPVTLKATINMLETYAQSGVIIHFDDYVDNYYWDDKEYNEDYFYDYYTDLINLPNTYNSHINMKYYHCFEGETDYTLQSHITITDITYSFDDTTLGQLCIIYEFEGYVHKAMDGRYYVINANIYDKNNIIIRSISLLFDGVAGEVVSDYNWITLYTSEIEKGISIKFEDEYWNDNDVSKYEKLIEIENNASVSYGIFCHSVNSYIDYADIWIEWYTYSFDYSQDGKLTISFILNCYINLNFVDEFLFEVATYNSDNEKINSKYVSGQGNAGDLIKIETQIALNITDVLNGVVILFNDYYVD